MRYPKLMSIAVMLVVFGSVGGIAWAIVSSHGLTNSPGPAKVSDDVMHFMAANHPETSQFITNLSWTGGRQENSVGAETYVFESEGWRVVISYPVIPNAAHTVAAEYHATGVTIPYAIAWHGSWTNGAVTEVNYTFAQ